MNTVSQELGTGTNPADALPRLGQKTLNSEAAVSNCTLMKKELHEIKINLSYFGSY